MEKKLIEWTPDLQTGLLWQDTQHRDLIENINLLNGAIMAQRGGDEVKDMVNFLDGYMDNHFCIEEKYMEVYGYPEAGEHRDEHRKFRGDLESLKQLLGHASIASTQVYTQLAAASRSGAVARPPVKS